MSVFCLEKLKLTDTPCPGTRTWALWPLCFHVWILPHLLGEDISHCRSVCRRLIPALPLNARDCTRRRFSQGLSVLGVICESSV